MEMREKILRQFQVMSAQMEQRNQSSSNELQYHFMADAVYWIDEIPDELDVFSENCLRIVLRYRMSLIEGASQEKWKSYWEEAKKSFPAWVGFREDRCRPNAKILNQYRVHKARAEQDLPEDGPG